LKNTAKWKTLLLEVCMSSKCPKCNSENIYQEGLLWICPECSNEWTESSEAATADAPIDTTVRDMNGKALADGDSVIVAKDLKIKGASSVVKGGTKVRNIRLNDAGDGHNISCKVEGLGAINLKSEFVRKA
jgi:protein PhnA